jgi:ribosomal protein S18 acetylase RimI-like enzyme
MTSNDDDADAAPASGDLWIGPADEAEWDDVTYVAPMHLRAWKHCYAKFVVPNYHLDQYDEVGFVVAYHNLIDEVGYTMWLAKRAGVPIALAIFGRDPDDHGRGWIDTLYVAREWQRHPDIHVGTRLLDPVLDQMDYAKIALDCATQNDGGRSFWEDRGFYPIGEGDSFQIPGYGAVNTVRYELEPSKRSSS